MCALKGEKKGLEGEVAVWVDTSCEGSTVNERQEKCQRRRDSRKGTTDDEVDNGGKLTCHVWLYVFVAVGVGGVKVVKGMKKRKESECVDKHSTFLSPSSSTNRPCLPFSLFALTLSLSQSPLAQST